MAYKRVEFCTGSGKRVVFRARVKGRSQIRVKKTVSVKSKSTRRRSRNNALTARW